MFTQDNQLEWAISSKWIILSRIVAILFLRSSSLRFLLADDYWDPKPRLVADFNECIGLNLPTGNLGTCLDG
jgi:hypothetical protein